MGTWVRSQSARRCDGPRQRREDVALIREESCPRRTRIRDGRGRRPPSRPTERGGGSSSRSAGPELPGARLSAKRRAGPGHSARVRCGSSSTTPSFPAMQRPRDLDEPCMNVGKVRTTGVSEVRDASRFRRRGRPPPSHQPRTYTLPVSWSRNCAFRHNDRCPNAC